MYAESWLKLDNSAWSNYNSHKCSSKQLLRLHSHQAIAPAPLTCAWCAHNQHAFAFCCLFGHSFRRSKTALDLWPVFKTDDANNDEHKNQNWGQNNPRKHVTSKARWRRRNSCRRGSQCCVLITRAPFPTFGGVGTTTILQSTDSNTVTTSRSCFAVELSKCTGRLNYWRHNDAWKMAQHVRTINDYIIKFRYRSKESSRLRRSCSKLRFDAPV